ncbi:MAG: hypothetical protein QNJ98_12065 [Planctomycetota bacterium]|nr:hypothetical protein [Planctomycetota bacterium]
MRLTLLRRAALALVLVVPLGSTAVAELDAKTWNEAKREAGKLMNAPGELAWKEKVIGRIAEDDSERAAELLIRWALASLKLEQKTLVPERDKTQEKFDKLVKLLLKAYDKMPPKQAEHRKSYDTEKKKRDDALAAYEAEKSTQSKIAYGLAQLTDRAAIDYLLAKGEKRLAKKKGSDRMVLGIIQAYLKQPQERIAPRLLAVAKAKDLPEARIRVLNWIADNKMVSAFDVAVACLKGPEMAVKRSAVFTLEVLDDPRAVKHLIGALAKANGLYAEELESTLHYFTGRSFESSHKIWSRWWAKEGASWLATEADKRHEKRPATAHEGGTTSFYGVETKSKRIVFVLDRSGSMKSPASEESRKPEKPKGPVTGGGKDGEKDADPDIKGDTKMEVAKNQLAWSIKTLPKDVYFNVVFFSNAVEVWKTPPEMVPATPGHKSDATEWFMKIDAAGSTRTFEALLKALDYAANEGGADTIFLLSDGSPTIPGGTEALKGEALETEYGAFLERNKLYKCVVHTIGVGPQHNRTLMRRIANDTGGTYRGVGDK